MRRRADRSGPTAGGVLSSAPDGATSTETSGAGLPDGTTVATALFELGSVTKVVTTLLLGVAVVRGEVALETPLHEVLDGPAPGPGQRPATMAQLASHTAGTPRTAYGPREETRRLVRWLVAREDPWSGVDADALLARHAARRRTRRPEVPRYSNVGAALLGHALVAAAGAQDYEQLVAQRVAKPLGMRSMTTRPGPELRDRVVPGRSRRGRPVPSWDLSGAAGAGALVSGVDDVLCLLGVWLRPGDDVVGDAVRLLSAHREGSLGVALGWQRREGRGHELLWHNGATAGSTSWVSVGSGVGVVVLHASSRRVDLAGAGLQQRAEQAAGPSG